MARIEIAPSHRVLILGKTGSGKSYLARKILMPRYATRPVVLDPKGMWKPTKTMPVVEGFEKKLDAQIIRMGEPGDTARDDISFYENQIRAAFHDAPRTIIIDELTAVTPSREFPRWLKWAIKTGRETPHGPVGIWMLTQSPAWIPRDAYRESEHLFCFRLKLADDRKTVRDMTTDSFGAAIASLKEHDYLYYNEERDIEERVIQRERPYPLPARHVTRAGADRISDHRSQTASG